VTGDFIEQIRAIKAVQVGPTEHFTVIKPCLHPGFFARLLTLQKQFWEIYLCPATLAYRVRPNEGFLPEHRIDKVQTRAGTATESARPLVFLKRQNETM
jgi:hypothetical protein